MFFLFLYIFANKRLIQTYRANAIATRPETSTKKSTLGLEKFTMNTNRTFTLKIPYRHRYLELTLRSESKEILGTFFVEACG